MMESMKVISFINMKGGVAKTTLSVNVAHCLATRNKFKVLLVDIDPQFNATQCIISGDEYVEYLKSGKDTVVSVFDRALYPSVGLVSGTNIKKPKNLEDIEPFSTAKGFDLLPGSLDLYRLEMGSGEGRENRLRNYLTKIKDDYDYVIIDTPPTPSIWMTSALLASDYYLIPVKTDPISLTGIDLLHSIIAEKTENFGLTIKCCGLVFTIVEKNTMNYKNALDSIKNSERWKDKLFSRYLAKRTKIANEQLKQTYILDMDDPEVKTQLVGITSELLERIKKNG
jgi:chromosome partitioning protein